MLRGEVKSYTSVHALRLARFGQGTCVCMTGKPEVIENAFSVSCWPTIHSEQVNSHRASWDGARDKAQTQVGLVGFLLTKVKAENIM